MIEIRRAGPADGHVLGEIHAAAWEAAYAPFFAPEFAARAVEDRRHRWHARVGGDTPAMILVGVADARPLALTSFAASPGRGPGAAEIFSVYAHPDGWGSGLAAALMDATLRHLREDGFAQAHLWTLRDTPRSRRFYAKCGFHETGASRPYDFGDGVPLEQVEYERTC
jgi:RimJ/RimL family protein N-acetyltransferase